MSGTAMQTKGWRLTSDDVTRWIERLAAAGTRVVAPVEDNGLRRFQEVRPGRTVCLAPGKTRWSPKEYLLPRTETLFSYSVQGGDVNLDPPPADGRPHVLLGVRPCDAAGLGRLDAIYLGGEADPLYAARRERTTIVSLACNEAGPECFCTAVGGSPAAAEGSDAQLMPHGDGWLLCALTPRGEALAAALDPRVAAAAAGDWIQADEQVQRVVRGLKARPIARQWAEALEKSFDRPLWEALGRRCLGCSICTYVCPSCSCFDVQDTGNARCGTRCRSWDSCTFGMFTKHASGHNPRGTQAARYRQRVLHKFAYFPLQHEGQLMCVGCGRCVSLCPVGMDVHDSVQRVMAAAAEGGDGR